MSSTRLHFDTDLRYLSLTICASVFCFQHMFHTACLHEWLQVGNSCPICRVTIAAKRTGHNDPSTGLSAQQRGDFAWSEWFS